ncbi:dipeptidase PepE [Spongiimicrobium salis]|uniref:dipeptidase PepE n=1 Tax=Spongiimicrobium salis TaxID=1667022 RepID=UPI00374D56BD
MKKLLLASTSTLFGESYLKYLLEDLAVFFKDINTITFIPYARPSGISHDDYTALVALALSKINKKVIGLHSYEDGLEGIAKAEAIFAGGGNSFVLVDQLHRLNLMEALKKKILEGMPYLGTSAGSNIAGPSIKTSNDMPIVYPPSFDSLGLVNFNINPHYMDPDPKSTHNGETRETRIAEFHCYNTIPVIGLREGDFILVNDQQCILKGPHTARVFEAGKAAYETSKLDL